jgi:superfamily II DNA or RNA helicase
VAVEIRLRPWQREALNKLKEHSGSNFLAVATPGAGKTAFALTAARRELVNRTVRRIVTVVPTQHLKHQWANAAEQFDIHLDPDWSAGDGRLPTDVHGVAVTYQQVAANPRALRGLVAGSFVVLDEIHHAADSRSWGDAVRFAFEHAHLRLCLSGTPFRSDQSAIPFVHYSGEEAVPDYEYGYGEALRDRRVVRPVYFPRINGRMEWSAPDGSTYQASFDDKLSGSLSSQRLRTALDLEGEWLPSVLAKAHRQVMHLRSADPTAAGMVIAMDQEHARGIARIFRSRLGVEVAVATSDDPAASDKIAAFAENNQPWIVAVRMVSEGVDIPRLRVGVYATNTSTDLFFRQAVGRLVRFNGMLEDQGAYMFIPDDWRLRSFAFGIAEQRRHSLKKPDRDGEEPPLENEQPVDPLSEEQMSLFTAISAVPLEEDGQPLEPTRIYEAKEGSEFIPGMAQDPQPQRENEDEEEFSLSLSLPELEVAVPLPMAEPQPELDFVKRSARGRKRALRERNSHLVRSIVNATSMGHADVNSELNRQAGIRRVTEATSAELEKRLEIAERWLSRL